MFNNIEKIFKSLVGANFFISVVITYKIFILNNYSFLEMSAGLVITAIYASIWFYALYKIYNFSKSGLRIYISLTIIGFFSILYRIYHILIKQFI